MILDEVSKCFVMLWSGDKLLKFYIFNNNVVMEFDACCDSDIGTGKATVGGGEEGLFSIAKTESDKK